MEADTETVSAGEARGRRRRSRSKAIIDLGRLSWIRSSMTGIVVFWTMVAIGGAYAFFTFYVTWIATFAFGDLTLDIDKDEVSYQLGAPPAQQESSSTWAYLQDGAFLRVRFDDGKMLKSIFCSEYEQDNAGCTNVLGLTIGSTEEQLFLQLGGPDQSFYDGDDKILVYEGMGLTFRLRRLSIVGMETHRRSSFLSFLPEGFWMLVP